MKRLLQEFPGYEVVGEADNGETALDVIDDEEPDLVLLDIRMGGMDGLQVGRQLAEMDVPPAIIFTTAYSEHALSAFDANAQAYRSEEHTSELQSLMRISYAVFCLKKKHNPGDTNHPRLGLSRWHKHRPYPI